mmetsp:Transcript_33580/g.106567  ORF Transcript_33580/g.106567 Transcript_33580/m.106567 type:complete len:277 (-) Transcript_33580:141-971(-)
MTEPAMEPARDPASDSMTEPASDWAAEAEFSTRPGQRGSESRGVLPPSTSSRSSRTCCLTSRNCLSKRAPAAATTTCTLLSSDFPPASGCPAPSSAIGTRALSGALFACSVQSSSSSVRRACTCSRVATSTRFAFCSSSLTSSSSCVFAGAGSATAFCSITAVKSASCCALGTSLAKAFCSTRADSLLICASVATLLASAFRCTAAANSFSCTCMLTPTMPLQSEPCSPLVARASNCASVGTSLLFAFWARLARRSPSWIPSCSWDCCMYRRTGEM